MHDSTQADLGGLYTKIRKAYNDTGGKVVVDSAFKIGKSSCFIRSGHIDPLGTNSILENRDATSVRQLTEWGMRDICGSFPHINDKTAYDEIGERHIILSLMVHIYNIRTRIVGMNTIANTYMPHWSPDNNFLSSIVENYNV